MTLKLRAFSGTPQYGAGLLQSGHELSVAVFAHPDDEIGCIGTLARHAARGDKVMLVWTTLGELASQFGDASHEEVTRIRREHGAWVAAQIGAEHTFFDMGDSRMTGGRDEALQLARLYASFQPNAVITWSDDHPHPDHRMSGQNRLRRRDPGAHSQDSERGAAGKGGTVAKAHPLLPVPRRRQPLPRSVRGHLGEHRHGGGRDGVSTSSSTSGSSRPTPTARGASGPERCAARSLPSASTCGQHTGGRWRIWSEDSGVRMSRQRSVFSDRQRASAE